MLQALDTQTFKCYQYPMLYKNYIYLPPIENKCRFKEPQQSWNQFPSFHGFYEHKDKLKSLESFAVGRILRKKQVICGYVYLNNSLRCTLNG